MNAVLLKYRPRIYTVLNWIVLSLSVALITYVSVLAFRNVEFMSDTGYMRFQLWVCIVFILDFFAELYLASR